MPLWVCCFQHPFCTVYIIVCSRFVAINISARASALLVRQDGQCEGLWDRDESRYRLPRFFYLLKSAISRHGRVFKRAWTLLIGLNEIVRLNWQRPKTTISRCQMRPLLWSSFPFPCPAKTPLRWCAAWKRCWEIHLPSRGQHLILPSCTENIRWMATVFTTWTFLALWP